MYGISRWVTLHSPRVSFGPFVCTEEPESRTLESSSTSDSASEPTKTGFSKAYKAIKVVIASGVIPEDPNSTLWSCPLIRCLALCNRVFEEGGIRCSSGSLRVSLTSCVLILPKWATIPVGDPRVTLTLGLGLPQSGLAGLDEGEGYCNLAVKTQVS